jgi:methylmalonyl-CoA/ethylmalonyl-CoA epimerase
MKILGIEHIAIAVENLENGAKFWKTVMGLDFKKQEDVPEQGVLTDIYDLKNCKIELIQKRYPNSPISNFLKKNGPGIHHICLEIDDIEKAILELKSKNIKTIGSNYSIGAEGYKIIFLHPSSTGGVLIELAQKN